MRNEQERAISDKDFEKSILDKQQLFDLIKETLIKTTEKEFDKNNYKKSDKDAGVYGNGETYGTSPENEKFIIRVSGKTLPSIEKTIQLGGKRLTSAIKCIFSNNRIKINYNSPENTSIKNLLVRKEISVSADLSKDKIKKELEKLFSEAAFFEVKYLQSAKLGTEDGLQNYYNPNKPNITLIDNTMTIKEIFTNDSSSIEESKSQFKSMPKGEQNIEKVKDKNTIPLNGKKGKSLLFDKENIKEIVEKVKNDKDYKRVFQDTLKDFGVDSFGALKSKGAKEVKNFFNTLDKKYVSKEEKGESVDEITTAGAGGVGGTAGSFGYLTPYFAKADGKSKDKKKLKAPYIEFAEGELSENTDYTKKLDSTPYFQNRKSKKPQVDKNWNILSEVGGDPYNIPVKIDPNYHPQGMPFIKPGSEEELKAALTGDPDKLKRMGIKKINEAVKKVNYKLDNETEHDKIKRLTKKKFSNIVENEEKGINKRYIITEKTTEEFEKERMSRLANFKLYETIKSAEDLNSELSEDENFNLVDEDVNNIFDSEEKEIFENKDILNEEECIEVQKPESMFGLKYKFKKKDFLNEEKKYILDLNSMVFVPKPCLK
jgi:hypothetical protein